MKQPSLKATLSLIALLACLARTTIVTGAPRPCSSTVEAPAGVIGEVVSVTADPHTWVLSVKIESGATVSIVVDEFTEVKRVPTGEKSIDSALGIEASEIATGDCVYARGAHPDGSGTARARQLIVMSRVDIQQRQEGEVLDFMLGPP